MDKQTGSNSSSQSTSESPRDISLGCGPSQASSAAASSPSAAAGGNSASSASAGNSKFAPLTTSATMSPQKIAPSGNIPLPLGAPISGAVVGATQLHQPQQQQQTSLPPPITLNINTTTGGNFSVIVDASNTVENLKKVIARKLKVAKDRICLLHREKELNEGTLKDNGLQDGSKIILIPNVETGLLAQRPENTVMQALESLNDSQVNDFLSGKTPLNLSMRLGDHMMLIQLQLSTVNPVNTAAHSGSSSRTRSSQRSSRSSSSSAAASSGHNHHSHHHHHHHHHHTNSASNSSAATAPVASTSAAARKLDVDAATAAQGQRQRTSTENGVGTSAIPNLRIPSSPANTIKSSDLSSFLSKRDYESLQNIVRSIAMAQPANLTQSSAVTSFPVQSEKKTTTSTLSMEGTCCGSNLTSKQGVSTVNAVPSTSFHSSEAALLEQSPIKSLSNLVSSPIKTAAIKNIPISSSGNSSSNSTGPATASTVISTCQDPISAKLTSCLCTRLGGTGAEIPNGTLKNCVESQCQSRKESSESSITESRSTMLTSTPNYKSSSSTALATASSLLHKTANNPILRSKHRHHHHHHHHHHHYHHHGNGSTSTNNSTSSPALRKVPISPRSTSGLSTTNDSGFASENDSTIASLPAAVTPTSQSTPTANAPVDLDDSGVTVTDTRTLAEASRNLTQTLRKLSKEVFTNKIDLSSEETSRKSNSGAVIESMKNHGKGIYSGTFSGTLNPALQDRYGRPKRDISTVIHILNDLLSATPQYSRGARISFEAPSTTSAATTSATTSGLAGHSSRSKQFPSKHHHHYSHSHADSCLKCAKTHHQSANTSNASHICAYGECNGHYTSKQTKHSSSYTCCQDLSGPSSHHHSPQTSDANNHSDRNTCSCRFVISDSGEREREHMCQKCLVEMENNKTKSKLDQLRLVMQQRKQKREARKLKGAPYGARVVGTTTGVAEAAATVTAATTVNGNNATGSAPLTTPMATASPSEVSPNHIVEEVDTAA